MKTHRIFFTFLISLFCLSSAALAIRGIVASQEDIARLKRDLLEGKIHIGKTRLMFIQNEYGEAPNINDDERRITYDYDDLRLVFERERIWREWDYDTFRDPVYSNNVADLRFDLEAKELVGNNISFSMIERRYGEPTESFETNEDGAFSIYYYGDIKLVFENVIAVRSWRGTNLDHTSEEPILGSIAEDNTSKATAGVLTNY